MQQLPIKLNKNKVTFLCNRTYKILNTNERSNGMYYFLMIQNLIEPIWSYITFVFSKILVQRKNFINDND